MRRTETVTVQAEIEHAYSVLSELTTYTEWLNFIDSVEPVESEDDLGFGCSSSKPNWGLSHE
ncbi:MAG: hypothetical protein Ct9H90mP30_3730 [Actinomycetota bacterium]|nr:MAG: hypothetical protein Ct9H90mP30_3730 [Actinomycetota bacterium]